MARLLQIENVRLTRPDETILLDEVDLNLERGQTVSIMGPSGSGKTTLLNCIAGLAMPAGGRIVVDGLDIGSITDGRRSIFRLKSIGLVFQYGELLPELSVIQNVSLPARLAGTRRAVAESEARDWLERLGLAVLADRAPHTLSGGEAQRVALARAVAHRPSVILADEPTGMLDEDTSKAMIGLLIDVSREIKAATIIVTHDPSIAAAAERTYRIARGQLKIATVAAR